MPKSKLTVVPSHSPSEVSERVVGWVLAERLKITAFTQSIVGDWQTAEDIFQEVCLRVMRESGQFAEPVQAVRWSMRVARNAAVDHIRKMQVRANVLSPEVLEKITEDWEVEVDPEVSQIDRLLQCLEQLTPRVRSMLRMRYEDGEKSGAIAEALNQKAETVYKTMMRAHAKLRKCMEQAV
jgi:RNA polymerase sigma-70 factor (ECF subfamily)